MSYAIAAAGTGGHVYPGLAVGEALVGMGVARGDVLFVGSERLEATVFPAAGFPFLAVRLRGIDRRLTVRNLPLPGMLFKAAGRIRAELSVRRSRVVLGMGSYLTLAAGWAARRLRIPVMVAEQNAEAGLANRLVAPFAERVFTAFSATRGLATAEWVGNPIRSALSRFDRRSLRPDALLRYGLQGDVVTLGIFGGSLGAGVLNAAAERMVTAWPGPPSQFLHIAGRREHSDLEGRAATAPHRWVVRGFEDEMQYFYAACDLVLARAGGAVAEITATATPAVLVPASFGSGRHQLANAEALARAGAAVILREEEIESVVTVMARLAADPATRRTMSDNAGKVAKPEAAVTIAEAMVERHG